jgi:YegS/Rv2252/BmrU family lipid kinase
MKVILIVKPIGSFRLKQLRKILEVTFDKKKDSFDIYVSIKKGHSTTLTQKALKEKADIVVACGGDGTINEVARELVETEVALGIIPLGSGNGIARHYKIPFDLSKAIQLIQKNRTTEMDVGVVNGHYFFGNMGCAFESHFIKKYQKNRLHGLVAYVFAFFDAMLSFRHQKIKIQYNQKIRQISPFVFLVSNTNQQGYDFTVNPTAKTNDGKLDLFWMEKSSLFAKLKFFFSAMLRKKLRGSEFNSVPVNSLKISLINQDDFCLQVDGEYVPCSEKTLEVKVLPKKLKVIFTGIA